MQAKLLMILNNFMCIKIWDEMLAHEQKPPEIATETVN